MTQAFKHYGRIKNVNRACVVVFRQQPDAKGRIVDPHSCLVIDLDSLPDKYRAEIERIVSSEMGQRSANIYDVFKNERFSFNGENVMQWFNDPANNRMQKVSVYNVAMKPSQNVEVELWELNVSIEMRERGAGKEEINARIAEMRSSMERDAAKKAGAPQAAAPHTPFGDSPAPAAHAAQAAPAPAPTPEPAAIQPFQAVGNEPLQNADVAAKFRADAERFEAEAAEYRRRADELDPGGAESAPGIGIGGVPAGHDSPGTVYVPEDSSLHGLADAQSDALASLTDGAADPAIPDAPVAAPAPAPGEPGGKAKVELEW